MGLKPPSTYTYSTLDAAGRLIHMTRSYTALAVLSIFLIVSSLVYAAPSAPPVLYGHRVHDPAPGHTLARAGRYRASGRVVMLRRDAARAFKDMQAEAARAGVGLVPISGFRSVAYQERLFERAVARYGSRAEAARRVAPSGYSEHHTGEAVDIGNRDRGECDVEACFARTRAYAWLRENARRFGFELSFPKAGPVEFEPWHWRFGGWGRNAP